jgi:anti-sigma factor RsiW
MTHVSDDELILHFYGELSAADRARVSGHLGVCQACAASDVRLRQVLDAVDEVPAPEPAAGFEQAVWARLQPALARRRAAWWHVWMWTPAQLSAAAAVALLVVFAFVAGRYWSAPGAPAGKSAAIDAAASAQAVRERILLVAVGDHLEQTQMVLVELAHADGRDTVNISAARAQAAELVADNRLYRQTAVTAGDVAIVSVLEDLERALIEVARCPSQVPRRDLDAILRGIEDQGLLFKLRVVSERVREREESAGALTRRAES